MSGCGPSSIKAPGRMAIKENTEKRDKKGKNKFPKVDFKLHLLIYGSLCLRPGPIDN